MYDVVVLYYIGFIFGVYFVCFFCILFVIVGDVVVIGDGFGVDEVVFKVIMNYVCCLRG